MSDGERPSQPEPISSVLRSMMREGDLELPLPGAGRTALRHRRLASLGRRDLSVGRLAEAHCDALAILAEAGRAPRPGALYGVWAAERPGTRLALRATIDGPALDGTKAFCTGVGLCDVALVTVEQEQTPGVDEPDRPRLLIEVDLASLRLAGRLEESTAEWATTAFAETATGSIAITAAPISRDDVVGDPGWYLDRPGFWHGAIGPAAVWAGGALALIDTALARASTTDPHVQAQLGALRAVAWSLDTMLAAAGDEIDDDPTGASGRALERALAVRHLVERQATEVMDRFGRATGPALLASDPDTARRFAELTLYVRQSHADRDLAALQQHAQDRVARGTRRSD